MNTIRKQIMIVDCGSQYTLLIARELAKMNVSSMVVTNSAVDELLNDPLHEFRGIIISGGSASVYDENAPKISEEVFKSGLPILGICYGMQYMAFRDDKDSVIRKTGHMEYGPTIVKKLNHHDKLFWEVDQNLLAWASHGDSVKFYPQNYSAIATADSGVMQAMKHTENEWYGVQFHPEVLETKDEGKILSNFAFKICGCEKDWWPEYEVQEILQDVNNIVYDGKALIGVSGGVDSTTLAALLAPVMGKQLYACFIDTGAMRKGEVEEVKSMCESLNIELNVVDATERFIDVIGLTTDAEKKRHAFKLIYKEIFSEVILENEITHIIQGTLATDLIESGASGNSSLIKSHHNVNLDFGVTEIIPLAHLFKHEVRDIARANGFDVISERQPFPGPGLFIRIFGTPVTKEKLAIVREADHIVTSILKNDGIYSEISQLIVAMSGGMTVGVGGDERSYKYPIVIRAVKTTDFMTVVGMELPSHLRQFIITALTSAGLTNRVFFDETPKPPATTEME